jgi:hypothetical protein
MRHPAEAAEASSGRGASGLGRIRGTAGGLRRSVRALRACQRPAGTHLSGRTTSRLEIAASIQTRHSLAQVRPAPQCPPQPDHGLPVPDATQHENRLSAPAPVLHLPIGSLASQPTEDRRRPLSKSCATEEAVLRRKYAPNRTLAKSIDARLAKSEPGGRIATKERRHVDG